MNGFVCLKLKGRNLKINTTTGLKDVPPVLAMVVEPLVQHVHDFIEPYAIVMSLGTFFSGSLP